MRFAARCFVFGLLVSMYFAGTASAQYMKITTDNPTDNTRMRATGTTILTITLDTNHDKNGVLQTCNSHTVLNCGALPPSNPLDMFSYTLALKAVGGTVTWGTFSGSDANYTDTSPQIQSDTEVEINKSRPTGTFTPPGLATLGTIAASPGGVNVPVGRDWQSGDPGSDRRFDHQPLRVRDGIRYGVRRVLLPEHVRGWRPYRSLRHIKRHSR